MPSDPVPSARWHVPACSDLHFSPISLPSAPFSLFNLGFTLSRSLYSFHQPVSVHISAFSYISPFL